MKDVVLFGIQGSGKGTQAKILLDSVGEEFSYFSSGDLFRALTSADNAIGNYVKDRIARGDLINDKVTNALFESYFYTVLHDKKHMLLDGYPRSVPQMEDMFRLVGLHKRELLGIYFVLPDQIAIERMKERGRTDDTDTAIHKRIEQFYASTMPMIDFFASFHHLIQVDANRPIDAIAEEVYRLTTQ